jgi:hypothetical protein
VPTSVLLAVLAAAGLLALAPALVRRYDATERLVAERALSTARVLCRAGTQPHRRRRTVPGRRPVNPPRAVLHAVALAAAEGVAVGGGGGVRRHSPVGWRRPVSGIPAASGRRDVPATGGRHGVFAMAGRHGASARGGRRGVSAMGGRRPGRGPRRLPHSHAVYRRRRVFAALLLLNIVEIVGVAAIGPGFWVGAAVTGALLVAYLAHLRNRAIAERRRRRAEARYAAWVAARQAAVRREQARRAAAKREALRQQLLEREAARRAAARSGAVRGRSYEARADRLGSGWAASG